jgi:hypothetical protein
MQLKIFLLGKLLPAGGAAEVLWIRVRPEVDLESLARAEEDVALGAQVISGSELVRDRARLVGRCSSLIRIVSRQIDFV